MPLDLSRLVGLRKGSGKSVAQCPACAQSGADASKQHLVIFESGKFGCCVDNSAEHSREIWQLVGIDGPGEVSLEPPPEPQVELPRVYPSSVLDGLIDDPSYWIGRGISEETIRPFRGGVATRYQMIDRFVFPQFNEDDEIIGFSGRCLRKLTREERKRQNRVAWKHLSPSSTFLWGGLDETRDCGEADLVESIGDGLMLREHGRPQNQCLFGVTLSEVLLSFLISANPRRINVATNRDVLKLVGGRMQRPGQAAALRIKRTLDAFFDEGVVRIVHPPEQRKDWGECNGEEIAQAFASDEVAAEQSDPAADQPAPPDDPINEALDSI